MATLEGGVGALAASSGMAAIFMSIITLARAGDNIVSTSYLQGGTYNQFKVLLSGLGIETKFVNGASPDDINAATDENTKIVFVEFIVNPQYNIPDLRKIAEYAHAKGVVFIVDNTCGGAGYLCRPIDHGADVVIHSATKWIGGHGCAMGGVIIDSGKFPWGKWKEKFPMLTEPTGGYHGIRLLDKYGTSAFIAAVRLVVLRDIGPTLSPFSAFLLLQGLETLSLRMKCHVDNSLKLAEWLQSRSNVNWVSYPGLESHPSHDLAKSYLRHGYGSVLSFGVKGGEEAIAVFLENLHLITHTANLGDAKTVQPVTIPVDE